MTPYSPLSGLGLAGNPMSGLGFLNGLLRPKNSPVPDNQVPEQAASAEKGSGKTGMLSALKGLGKKKREGFDYRPQVEEADVGPSTAGTFLQALFGV